MRTYSSNPAREATSCSRTAGNYTRRAERDAHSAETYYRQAAKTWAEAAWLTQRPDLWDAEHNYTPADRESMARAWERIGNTFLRASFHATGMAAHYRETAARYRETAARQAKVADYATV